MATNNYKFEYWGLIVNPPKEKATADQAYDFFNGVFSHLQDYNKIKFIASAIHDKDTHENGEPKTIHYHCMIETTEKMTVLGALRDFSKVLGVDKELLSLEGSNNLSLLVQYLTHKTKPNKHQYGYDVIKTTNAERCEELYNTEYEDPEAKLLATLENCKTMTQLARELGPTKATKYQKLFDRLLFEKNEQVENRIKLYSHMREKSSKLLEFVDEFFNALENIKSLGPGERSIIKRWRQTFDEQFWNEF